MKNAIMAMMVLFGMLAVCSANEVEGNPDRRMSIGINFNRNELSGDYTVGALTGSDFGHLTQNLITGDLRFPITSFLTFSIGGGYMLNYDMGLGVVTKDERWKMKGYNLNAGFRVYLP